MKVVRAYVFQKTGEAWELVDVIQFPYTKAGNIPPRWFRGFQALIERGFKLEVEEVNFD